MDTDAQIKEKLERCIIDTNKVILKWLDSNKKLKTNRIDKSSVESLFYGYLKKYLQINHIDFKRVRNVIDIHIQNGLLFVCTINDSCLEHHYLRDRFLIKSIIKLLPTIIVEELDLELSMNTFDITELNFKELELITF